MYSIVQFYSYSGNLQKVPQGALRSRTSQGSYIHVCVCVYTSTHISVYKCTVMKA